VPGRITTETSSTSGSGCLCELPSLLKGAPTFTGWLHTELAAFGRIDTVQTNALTANFDDIAINDGRGASESIL
jgi:hypothetical protein